MVHAFKAGGEKLWVRHMGREETELWYEEKDFTGIKMCIRDRRNKITITEIKRDGKR